VDSGDIERLDVLLILDLSKGMRLCSYDPFYKWSSAEDKNSHNMNNWNSVTKRLLFRVQLLRWQCCGDVPIDIAFETTHSE
jgi:hypothetical protein